MLYCDARPNPCQCNRRGSDDFYGQLFYLVVDLLSKAFELLFSDTVISKTFVGSIQPCLLSTYKCCRLSLLRYGLLVSKNRLLSGAAL